MATITVARLLGEAQTIGAARSQGRFYILHQLFMDENERIFRLDRGIKDRAEYHGELLCLEPGHHTALSVDVLDNSNGNLPNNIRLAIWGCEDDYDPAGLTDLEPDRARAVAFHLLRAADVADAREVCMDWDELVFQNTKVPRSLG